MKLFNLRKPEQRKLLLLVICVAVFILLICVIAFTARTVSKKKADKLAGCSFSTSGFSDITDIKCLNEQLAVYTDSRGKKGIMLLDGTITEKADEESITVVSDKWRSFKIIARGPRSEYPLLVDTDTGEILKKQYHGPVTPEKKVYWDEKQNRLVEKEGKTVSPVNAAEFMLDEGLYPVKNSAGEKGAFGYVSESLSLKLSFTYEAASDFSEELAAARKDGKWGYIDESGMPVIPFEFDPPGGETVCSFRNGLAPVGKDGRAGIINRSGDTVVSFNFDTILQGRNGVYIAQKNGAWGILTVNEDLFNAENTTLAVPEETAPASAGSYKVRTAGSPLNLRSAPDVSSDVLARIPDGSTVEVDKISSGWAHVTFRSLSGYVSADYIIKEEATSSQQITEQE